jgi:hypothetical protein
MLLRELIVFRLLTSTFFVTLMAGETSTDKWMNYGPFNWPFDASHAHAVLKTQFRVRTYQNWSFDLIIYTNGRYSPKEFADLLDDKEALFLTDDLEAGRLKPLNARDFLKIPALPTNAERSAAEEKASEDYRYAMHAAIHARTCDKRSKYSYLPQNEAGMIPLKIIVTQLDAKLNRVEILNRTVKTLGAPGGGWNAHTRGIASIALRPGYTYELAVEATDDSPAFFGGPFSVALGFSWKFQAPKNSLEEEGNAEGFDLYCRSWRDVS